MNFKPFYVHFNLGPGKLSSKFRGFTAHVAPHDSRNVAVKLTFCSKRDQFCKKVAREEVDHKPAQVVNARQLSKFMAQQRAQCHGHTAYEWEHHEYDYLYKYMV